MKPERLVMQAFGPFAGVQDEGQRGQGEDYRPVPASSRAPASVHGMEFLVSHFPLRPLDTLTVATATPGGFRFAQPPRQPPWSRNNEDPRERL